MRSVPGDPAYGFGYAAGSIVAALGVAAITTAAWGALRAEEERVRTGLRFARHWRTLSVAGFLWLIGTIGRVAG